MVDMIFLVFEFIASELITEQVTLASGLIFSFVLKKIRGYYRKTVTVATIKEECRPKIPTQVLTWQEIQNSDLIILISPDQN